MMKSITSIVLMGFLLAGGLRAELKLASPFADGMVLQRGMSVPVWGEADPGTSITVQFADQKMTTVSRPNGRWQIALKSMDASHQPRTFTVIAERQGSVQRRELANVLVGEVWICSGQSNMFMGHQNVPEVAALIPFAKNLRTFQVKNTVAFAEQGYCEGTWVEQPPSSAVAFAFAFHLEAIADVPVGIILAAWGSSSIEGWMPLDMTETLPHFAEKMQVFAADIEKQAKIETILNGPKPWDRPSDIFLRTQPNLLYNAVMHPLVPLACRGLVWYQGEANAGTMEGMLQYNDSLKAWIQRYRQGWGRDDLHLLAVMLPGYAKKLNGRTEDPNITSWAWMRESQTQVMDLPHAAVANTIDLGDPMDIHPRDKLPIGQRLALLAARDTLGVLVEAQGPTLSHVEVQNETLVVHFDHAAGLRTIDREPPTGFWVAGESGRWVNAEAELKPGRVVLRSAELSEPRYVRYAFAGKPSVNLVNRAGLPAYPFRTDDFDPPVRSSPTSGRKE